MNRAPSTGSTNDSPADLLWEKGWDGHAAAQAQRLAKLPLSVKLQWLEETQELFAHMEKARAKKSRE